MKTVDYNHVITAVKSMYVFETCFLLIQQQQDLCHWLFWHVT
jgi:hypothetical protein